MDLYIKGEKLTRQVNLINELDDDIISIDFMPIHKLHYVQSQANLAGMDSHNIVAIMVFILQHQIQRKVTFLGCQLHCQYGCAKDICIVMNT
jgi:hypothetical protein